MKTMIHVGGGASTANREPDQGVNEHPECRAHRHGAHKNSCSPHDGVSSPSFCIISRDGINANNDSQGRGRQQRKP